MQIKLFTIPILAFSDYEEELNAFLRSHKIVEIDKHLVTSVTGSHWCICVSYLEISLADKASKEKVDYMKVLDAETFSKFSDLRKIRKSMAGKEGVSAFVVFTDAELAEIAKKLPELSVAQLKDIKGIGKAKSEKYGAVMLAHYQQLINEKSGVSDATDSILGEPSTGLSQSQKGQST